MAAVHPSHRPGCARLGFARLKAFRLNVYESLIHTMVNGVGYGPGQGLRIDGATIEHALNDQTDTASFRTHGLIPRAGQTIQVWDGDFPAADKQIFGGRILETTVLYEERNQNWAYDINCIDPTWLLQRRLVLVTYRQVWAVDAIVNMMVVYTSGFTWNHISIPRAQPFYLDEITFTNESVPSCLTAICERIGAYWYVDYLNDLHVFTSEEPDAYPITQADPRTSRNHKLTEDLSQVVTRVIGRGGGVAAAVDVSPGSTEIPMDEGDSAQWYAATGGTVEVATQLVNYTGVAGLGGGGALIGTGNAPSNAPVVWASSSYGSALAPGTYQYAISFTTAAGESLPGPRVTGVTSNAMPPVPVQPIFRDGTYGPWSGDINQPVIGGWYLLRLVFPFDGGSYGISPASVPMVWNGKYWQLYTGPTALDPLGRGFTYYPKLHPDGYVPPSRYRQVWIDRTSPANNYGTFYGAGHIDVPTSVYWNDWYTLSYVWSDQDTINGAGGQHPGTQGPPFGSLYLAQLPVSSHPDITGRKVYRTTNGGTQLKLLEAINKTQTEYMDIKADAVLGANAPAADTSGIKETEGQVLQGATAVPVSTLSPFETDGGAGGGWVRIGGMAVKYAGIDTATGKLTGVPAAGLGSVTAIVKYGAQVLVQPRLTGVPASGPGSIPTGIRKGDTLTIRLVVEDQNAIQALASLLRLPGQPMWTPDGVVEQVVTDTRASLTELQAIIQATLQEKKDPRLTLTFESRDPSLEVGRLVTINLTLPAISGTFRIQRVSFREIAITGALARVHPLRVIEASNKLYTFADLLRQVRGREGGVG